jgi:allantoate deiminase
VKDALSPEAGQRKDPEKSLSDEMTLDVEADISHISKMIDAMAEIGRDPAGGITRLAYMEEERQAHDLAAGWFQSLGLDITTDAAGNTLAHKKGQDPSLPALVFGSHLDSVPHGGRFDGTAGVVVSIELIRMLQECDAYTDHSLTSVIFAAEEGARFREPCIGSKLFTGALPEGSLQLIRDGNGVSVAEAMSSIGLSPEDAIGAAWDPNDIALFLELHTEQGTTLEAESRQIGLVDSVSGSTRLRMTITGVANHSGATPMDQRSDAYLGGAEISLALENLANAPTYRGLRGTVGYVDVQPNNATTIPGRLVMIIDIRDTDSNRQRTAAVEVIDRAKWICDRRRLDVEVEVVSDNSPIVLPMWVREQIRLACEERGASHKVLASGASHDAQVVSRVAPTGMIFVPSRGGLSHVPGEWTSPAEIALGAEVLFSSIMRLDRLLVSFVS